MGRRTCYFLIFAFSLFQISNDSCQKSYNGLWVFLERSNTSQIFLVYTFLKRNGGSFKFLWNLHRNAFCFFFLNKRNITTFLGMIYLKCAVVHNLDPSSINKPFLNYGPLNMLFLFLFFFFFFDSLFTFVLTRFLCQKKLWSNYHFLMQISEIHFKM